MRHALLLSCLLAATTPSHAKDIYQQFAVFEAGGQPCGKYLAARAAGGPVMQRYHDWLSGYLSAFNLIVPSTYNILGTRGYPAVMRWLDEHCRANPDVLFVNAVANLTENLYPERRSFVDDGKPWGKE